MKRGRTADLTVFKSVLALVLHWRVDGARANGVAALTYAALLASFQVGNKKICILLSRTGTSILQHP